MNQYDRWRLSKGRIIVAQGVVTGETASSGAHSHNGHAHTHDESHRLGAFLCWAVVFADIGTSVYYTPGILYSQFGSLAGLFVTMTMVAFLLLALKYAEVSVRFPEGGGVVTVSGRALSPWFGALGGMFILVDYFLTAAISSLSGLQYLQDVIPVIRLYVLPATVVVIVLLGVLNWWGIKESAVVSAVIAVAAFISDIVIVVAVLISVPMHTILALMGEVFHGGHLTALATLTGFAGAFLAFSGLESISQLSPVMARPRSRTVSIALGLVVITVGLTSPILTIFATTLLNGQHTALLTHPIAHIDPNQFISQLGQAYGGPVIGIATAVTASALLIFASNTAIIGSYHVFMALSHMSFFPKIVLKRDPRRDTPIVSVALATIIPILILLFANGKIDLLGQLYAFGLLGAFALTCVSLDVLRFKELRGGTQIAFHDEEDYAIAPLEPIEEDAGDIEIGAPTTTQTTWQVIRRGWSAAWPKINFALGIITTILVAVAWITNLIVKREATIFGGGLTIAGMAIAIWHYRHEENSGRNTILPSWVTTYAPDTVLAIISTDSKRNREIIESALRWARGRKTLVYVLAEHPHDQPKRWQIELQAARDPAAQTAFRAALELGARTHTPVQVFYSTGGAPAAVRAWRVTHSRDVVADPETAKIFGKSISPTYVSFKAQDGVRVAHYVILPDAQTATIPALRPRSIDVAPPQRDGAELSATEPDVPDEALNLETYYQDDDEAAETVQSQPVEPRPSGAVVARHHVKIAENKPPATTARETPNATRQARETPNATRQAPARDATTARDEQDNEEEYPGYYWNGVDFVRKDEEEEPPPEK